MTMTKQNRRMQLRSAPCRLTADELAELRRDVAQASAWMRAELRRRSDAKVQAIDYPSGEFRRTP